MSFITQIGAAVREVGNIAKKTYGPLSALEQSGSGVNFTYGNLRYPLDVGDTHLYPHTVEFQCWVPIPTGLKDSGGNVFTGAQFSKTPTSAGVSKPIGVNTSLDDLASNINLVSDPRTITNISHRAKKSDLIALYIPQGAWNDSHGNDYQTKSLTDALGTFGGMGVEAISSLVGLWKEGGSLSAASNVLGSAVKMGTEGVIRAGILALNETVDASIDADTLVGVGLSSMGYAINPQFEVIYGSTEMRSFNFDFTMTPRNIAEAESCINIVKRLKYHASPMYSGGGGRYITPPSYFNIQLKYMGKLNENLPLISTCVLNKIDVNYSSGLEQFSTYKDGMPIQINMVLQFTEIEIMHKALRDKGY